MRSFILPTLLVSVTLLPTSDGPAGSSAGRPGSVAQSSGTVSGTVLIEAPPRSPPPPLSPYARRRAQPPQEPGVPQGSADAFVYLEPLGAPPPASRAAPARILQRDRTILPHSMAVRTGQAVEFPNNDDVFHNLFSLSRGNRFSLGRYAPGVSPTHTFNQPGVVRLFCDMHAEMAGVILVVDTPWVARVGEDGQYRLAGLPPGEYRAVAWHPTAGADTSRVVLASGQPVQANFHLVAAR